MVKHAFSDLLFLSVCIHSDCKIATLKTCIRMNVSEIRRASISVLTAHLFKLITDYIVLP